MVFIDLPGTELKQIYMHESTATTPDSLKASLSDPVLRHRHLTDADILEQTMDSLVRIKLRSDHHGNIVTFPEGGMRRIDYIMSRKDTPVVSFCSPCLSDSFRLHILFIFGLAAVHECKYGDHVSSFLRAH